MAKRNGTTRYAGNSQTSAANTIQSSTIGAPSNSGSTYEQRYDNMQRVREMANAGTLPMPTPDNPVYVPLDDRSGIYITNNAQSQVIRASLAVDGKLVEKSNEGRFYGKDGMTGEVTTQSEAFAKLQSKLKSNLSQVYEKYLYPEGRKYVEGATGSGNALMALMNKKK